MLGRKGTPYSYGEYESKVGREQWNGGWVRLNSGTIKYISKSGDMFSDTEDYGSDIPTILSHPE